MFLRKIATATTVALGVFAGAAYAEDPVLVIEGAGLAPEGVAFTMAELEAMPQLTFSTSTVWTEGVHEFSGVPLKAVIASVGATGTVIKARALNDYSIEIPMDSIEDSAPIIATRIDGEAFSRREKGPLWIVYPFDSDDRFQTELVYGRSIWQLNRLTLN